MSESIVQFNEEVIKARILGGVIKFHVAITAKKSFKASLENLEYKMQGDLSYG